MRWRVVICAIGGACSFRHGATAMRGDAADAIVADVDARAIDSADVGPALVQQTSGFAPSGTPLSATLGTLPVAGDMLVMIGAANHGALTSVTGGGAAWTRAARSNDNANIEIWFGVTDGSSATVSIELPDNPLTIWMSLSEWSGLATTNPLDQAAAQSGLSSPASSGGITTTHAPDLVLFAVADETPNTFGAPGQAWSSLVSIQADPLVQEVWYAVVASAGPLNPQVTETASAWDAAIAALEAAP